MDRDKPNQTTLQSWPKPQPGIEPDSPLEVRSPTLSDAFATITKEDFLHVAKKPCAREGLLTGIAAGAGIGGLKFLLQGNVPKAANWAVGIFVVGSAASYEYCQFRRRAQRRTMMRRIEIVNEDRREKARKAAEERQTQLKLEEEDRKAQKPWYKIW
ncbi:hypothetical protein L249_0045 [Ophiocordyceps polyrhachis-furcata BCC 54312]|uniref:Cytochrome c oxidase assembly protein COX20, mitochondrial n=1 Tax=Ophiocordyceps polyrhachis-furcata BCC 54312 TaxID=1330021 RepID=A0A367LD88_9HYPO|nr:hypothetical protein L249_0045 [Ophiocordyceps polyrhachis-furcata BCC 54312]